MHPQSPHRWCPYVFPVARAAPWPRLRACRWFVLLRSPVVPHPQRPCCLRPPRHDVVEPRRLELVVVTV
jgi:hypothetical protein